MFLYGNNGTSIQKIISCISGSNMRKRKKDNNSTERQHICHIISKCRQWKKEEERNKGLPSKQKQTYKLKNSRKDFVAFAEDIYGTRAWLKRGTNVISKYRMNKRIKLKYELWFIPWFTKKTLICEIQGSNFASHFTRARWYIHASNWQLKLDC